MLTVITLFQPYPNVNSYNPISALPQCQAVMTGYVRVENTLDDVYVDGNYVSATGGQLLTFSAPDNWQVLTIDAWSAVSPKSLIASLGPNTYTQSSTWKCSPTTFPDWKNIGYDDSAWDSPLELGGFDPLLHGSMDTRAKLIWGSACTGYCYCRTTRSAGVVPTSLPIETSDAMETTTVIATTAAETTEPIEVSTTASVPICDVGMRMSGTYFTRPPPGVTTVAMETMTRVVVVGGKVTCGQLCLTNATLCHHSVSVTCVPPSDGCCGYLYDVTTSSCDLLKYSTSNQMNVPGLIGVKLFQIKSD